MARRNVGKSELQYRPRNAKCDMNRWVFLAMQFEESYGCQSNDLMLMSCMYCAEGHLVEGAIWLVCLHHFKHVKWDVAGLPAAIT